MGCLIDPLQASFFVDGLDLPPAVVTAVLANDVRRFGFVTLRTLAQHRRRQFVVVPAHRGAPLRVSSFGIRHDWLFGDLAI
jgi:hypothetical protein